MGQKPGKHGRVRYRTEEREFEVRLNKKYIWIIGVTTFIVIMTGILGREWLKQGFILLLRIFGKCETEVFPEMQERADFLGGSVWTLFTILASFIIFYYGALGYRNYGISNRKIIGYTFGSWFLPALMAINGGVVLFMTIAFYLREYIPFYVWACYSCLLQALLIIICIKSTSQEECYRVIINIEQKQYQSLCGLSLGINEEIHGYQSTKEQEKNRIVYHIYNILNGDETLAEKFEIIQELLLIPFSEQFKGDSNNQETYYYLYHNMLFVAEYLCNNPGEEQLAYSVFYENIDCIQKKYLEAQEEEKTHILEKILIYLSAFFHSLVPKKLEQKYSFFECIVNEIITDETLREMTVMTYLESFLFLWYKNLVDSGEIYQKVPQNFIRSCRYQGIKEPQDLKEKMLPILGSWMIETTEGTNKSGWENMRKITENIGPYSSVDFIGYLYRILYI